MADQEEENEGPQRPDVDDDDGEENEGPARPPPDEEDGGEEDEGIVGPAVPPPAKRRKVGQKCACLILCRDCLREEHPGCRMTSNCQAMPGKSERCRGS